MKIESIDTIVLRVPYTTGGSRTPEPWGGKAWKTADALLVKVTTDRGHDRLGRGVRLQRHPRDQGCHRPHARADVHRARPADDRSLMLELQQKLHIFGRGGPVIFGLSGIDIALWDIAGKAAGQPVHQLLGGCRAPQLPCYASLIRYTDPKVVAANVERALGQGFRHIKLHEIEVAPTRAAREAAGDGRRHHAGRELPLVAARGARHGREAAAVQPALAGGAGVAPGELRRAGADPRRGRHPDRRWRERRDAAAVSADVRGAARSISCSRARPRWAGSRSCARSSRWPPRTT